MAILAGDVQSIEIISRDVDDIKRMSKALYTLANATGALRRNDWRSMRGCGYCSRRMSEDVLRTYL